MAGAPTIISQGVAQQITSYPGWKLPSKCRLVADITGGAAVVRAADTTPGVSCSNGAGGVFDITFPAGKALANINPQVLSHIPGTAVNRFFGIADVSTTNTNATTGKLRVVTASTGAAAIPNDTQVVDVTFEVDYG